MIGKIVKGIAGFYYIHVPDKGVYECKARGIFRNQKIKPYIGDNVKIAVLDEKEKLGNVLEILPRKNSLVRPTVANIDQAVIVFAVENPKPSFNLLDRFLVMAQRQEVNPIICFNKIDTLSKEDVNAIKDVYSNTGYHIMLTSAVEEIGISPLKDILFNKTTVFAGPSGVGKSSILNLIQSEEILETGEVSHKIKRGKHTTRHASLLAFHKDSYVVDTPGFSSLFIEDMEKEELKDYFIEFQRYKDGCKFGGCNHISEPKCAVKKAVQDGEISESRYNSYTLLYEELKDIRRW
ncbi:ribosome small subunit-dependent GTPase A [Vallitalea pronyensis]|uniref:Small ribosomal subunit biogenesis GTPase RsgA n=1 Tax=Vallitalea pronyensis TaxID=1348613 RepID=A0A8J8MK19_9FIRM|nr:ribosome small subunit-dependent GTPase A [Vallitalea pronyensis]QUI22926.1 ribosome small subunit-dependent GTPase A [Vallitalea pronyensis]